MKNRECSIGYVEKSFFEFIFKMNRLWCEPWILFEYLEFKTHMIEINFEESKFSITPCFSSIEFADALRPKEELKTFIFPMEKESNSYCFICPADNHLTRISNRPIQKFKKVTRLRQGYCKNKNFYVSWPWHWGDIGVKTLS